MARGWEFVESELKFLYSRKHGNVVAVVFKIQNKIKPTTGREPEWTYLAGCAGGGGVGVGFWRRSNRDGGGSRRS